MADRCPCRDPAVLDVDLVDASEPARNRSGQLVNALGYACKEGEAPAMRARKDRRTAHEGPCSGPTYSWPHKAAWPTLPGWAAYNAARSGGPPLVKRTDPPQPKRSRWVSPPPTPAELEAIGPQVVVLAVRLAGGGTLTIRSRRPERWTLLAAAKKLRSAEPTVPIDGPFDRQCRHDCYLPDGGFVDRSWCDCGKPTCPTPKKTEALPPMDCSEKAHGCDDVACNHQPRPGDEPEDLLRDALMAESLQDQPGPEEPDAEDRFELQPGVDL